MKNDNRAYIFQKHTCIHKHAHKHTHTHTHAHTCTHKHTQVVYVQTQLERGRFVV